MICFYPTRACFHRWTKKRTYDFCSLQFSKIQKLISRSFIFVHNFREKIKKAVKARDCYAAIFERMKDSKNNHTKKASNASNLNILTDSEHMQENNVTVPSDALVPMISNNTSSSVLSTGPPTQHIIPRKPPSMPKPKWHPPWKLYRVLSGHLGWVRCVAVEPGNEWIATGSGDRVIKIWDLASGKLKVSLTGHISTVRGLAVSARHPYLFSCGEDKQVKCWDLEHCKVIRHYHGHLSAVHSLALHPQIDVLTTAGRDSTARVWDMRTKANVHTLTGHSNTVASVICQAAEPQIITGSHDCTIRLWDLAAGKSRVTLTNHKKSVRALVFHPTL